MTHTAGRVRFFGVDDFSRSSITIGEKSFVRKKVQNCFVWLRVNTVIEFNTHSSAYHFVPRR